MTGVMGVGLWCPLTVTQPWQVLYFVVEPCWCVGVRIFWQKLLAWFKSGWEWLNIGKGGCKWVNMGVGSQKCSEMAGKC